MFCSTCGKEVSEKAIACPGCGCAISALVTRTGVPDVPGVAKSTIVLGYSFAFLFSLVGLILGIVTLTKGSEAQRGHGAAITIISGISMLIGIAMFANS